MALFALTYFVFASAFPAAAQAAPEEATSVVNNTIIGADGQEYQVRRLVSNDESAAYRPQTTGEKLSSAFSYEVKMGGRALENLVTKGDVGGVLGYARNVVGDVYGAGVDLVHSGVDKVWDGVDAVLDAASDIPVVGLVADYVGKPLAAVGEFITDVGFGALEAIGNFLFGKSNLECRQEVMDNVYKSGCYPCKIIKSLISAFLNGGKFLESVSQEAGKKILILGFFLWLMIYVMQQVSSFKNIEPASMVNDMLIMAFKVFGAWVVIGEGYQLVVNYVLVPFLGWGIDFGTYILTGATRATGLDISGTQVDQSYLLTQNAGMFPSRILNNLMTYVAAVDGTTTQHMKLGNMITCHATHHGAWNVGILIPNLWIWLCGAAIWFAGFMMTLSILFYLVDMSFKLSFALIALPIVVGLWPFSVTKDRLYACVKIIINAAGIFIFLSMTTAVGLVLVDSAIEAGEIAESGLPATAIMQAMDRDQGVQQLYEAIENQENDKISDKFMLWGSSCLLILFAYLYAVKIIGSTMSDYVEKFFPSSITDGLSPIHQKMVQKLDMIKQKALEPVNYAKDVVKYQGGKGLDRLAAKFNGGGDGNGEDNEDEGIIDRVQKISKKFDDLKKGDMDKVTGEANDEQKPKDGLDKAKAVTNMQAKDTDKLSRGDVGDAADKASDGAAQAMEAAGDGLKESGEAVKQAAKSAADAQKAAGDATAAVGDAAAIPTLGTSAAAGHTVQATTQTSAAVTQASGEIAGETLKQAGNIVKRAGKAMKRVNKTLKDVRKAHKQMQKVSKTAQKAMKNINQNRNSNNGGTENNRPENNEQNDDLISSVTSGKNK